MQRFTRRQFAALSAGAVAAALSQRLHGLTPANDRYFTVALLADTHIIDSFYKPGSEGSPEDNETILKTTPRLTSARDLINSLHPAIEQTFILGDFFHNYPSTDYDFYFKNTTRLDNAKAIVDGFRMPVHIGFGNHDYAVRTVDREMSHRLFKAKFNTEPYYAVDYKGFRFLHVNNFLGSTQDRNAANFNPGTGSLGETQLNWLEAQLQEHKPTFLFTHYPILSIADTEVRDYGLHPLLKKYKDTIQLVVTGHVHRWMDFAHTYGPQHYTMASTRYDPNAYMLLELDQQTSSWRFINADLVDWDTHYSRPWKQA